MQPKKKNDSVYFFITGIVTSWNLHAINPHVTNKSINENVNPEINFINYINMLTFNSIRRY